MLQKMGGNKRCILVMQIQTIITLQEHQRIRTNATVTKDSDCSVLMVVYEIIFFYIFQANLRNQ